MQATQRAIDFDPEFTSLLEQRFGDGQIYFVDDHDWGRFDEALRLGWVTEDGCLTAGGRRISLRCE